eukprot:TRINITY_DN54380_c0_g1_i1.p1 TRINITY_DN54380_c0_g1~~TRINITY_DN54380_c0_g1_i1.p1  ORF type:complete len:303 (-),score=29.13 TRINITY_DN54380_c0_g1_i1:211-1119(-)
MQHQGPDLIFSTSEPALAGYARSMEKRLLQQTTSFVYSEHTGINFARLDQHLPIHDNGCATILLLATGSSSYLWFDKDHCPRTVEICSYLQESCKIQTMRYVVCPTTPNARAGWMSKTSGETASIFREFLPDSKEGVAVWNNFDPDLECQSEFLPVSLKIMVPKPVSESPAFQVPTVRSWLSKIFKEMRERSSRFMRDGRFSTIVGVGLGLLLVYLILQNLSLSRDNCNLRGKIQDLQREIEIKDARIISLSNHNRQKEGYVDYLIKMILDKTDKFSLWAKSRLSLTCASYPCASVGPPVVR